MHDEVLVDVVRALARELDARHISWCVLRNHQDFPRPRSANSDIDLLVGCEARQALELLVGLAEPPCGIALAIFRNGGDLASVFLSAPGSPALHVDLIHRITWRGFELVQADALLSRVRRPAQVPVPSEVDEAAVSLLNHLLHRGEVKAEYRASIQAAARLEGGAFEECLRGCWSDDMSSTVAARAAAGDWAWFESWVPAARDSLRRRALRRPMRLLASRFRLAAGVAARLLHPPGLWIAMLGPDGCGKSTVGDAFLLRCQSLFPTERQRRFHWRPRWLPAPGDLATGSAGRSSDESLQPHGKSRHNRVLSLLRFGYFWLDFVLGHWRKLRPLIARGGLVVFDRYWQDFQVDQKRYRLRIPGWLPAVLSVTVPQPDLIFVLDAPVNVLRSRKQELPASELQAQLQALHTLASGNARFHVVSVDRPVADIVDDMERACLGFLDARNRRRLGLGAPRAGRRAANP